VTVPENGKMIGQVRRIAPCLSRLGYVLRSTGIDELPQLVNVLQGHMSFVGPRPHAVADDDPYAKFIATAASRQHLKPGFTGWSQINQGTTQLARMQDLLYIKNWSFLLDLKIIALTLFGLTSRRDEH
jgi:lipopolysaccharide/colanic/teichoic acid biosynthesis glycosyltransferase